MKIGNILAGIGIIIGFVGFIFLPLWNSHELPYKADPAYPKGGGWIALVQTGFFVRPGIILMLIGGGLCIISKLLPKRYWKTAEDLFEEEINEGYIKKETKEKEHKYSTDSKKPCD